MKKLLALEELAQFGLALYGISLLTMSVNYYLLVLAFFIPDLFAIGYLISKPVGAVMYNFSHHKFVAIAMIVVGLWMRQEFWILAGLLFYAHSAFDRILGYGLKYSDSFQRTHLGYIGKEKSKNLPD
jgi:Domain of unknown function (DUF4260)